ncbi:MAG: S41 family peptidase [Alistipes sp.]
MKLNAVVRYLPLLACMLCVSTSSAQVIDRTDSLWSLLRSRAVPIEGSVPAIMEVRTPHAQEWVRLHRVPKHPVIDSLLTPQKEQELLTEVNNRWRELGKDTLLSSDLVYCLRPYFDWLKYQDPHYRMGLNCPTTQRVSAAQKSEMRLPFNQLCVNDTVIINRSVDSLFRKGDQIVAINDVAIPEYLKYADPDRYNTPNALMHFYYFSNHVERFKVKLVRAGKEMEIEVKGRPSTSVWLKLAKAESLDNNIRTYADAHCGYIAIPEFFPMNSRLIKIVHKAILNFKKQGYTNVVLDLRLNPGGSGNAFDKLLSIFIHKPTVQYCRGQRLMVSKETLGDYDFLREEMIGQVVDIPAKYLIKEFATDPKMYVDGMKYYVLMSQNTGSIAASFCNILQYNDAAQLVGEPLLHNALKYGEVIQGRMLLPTLLHELAISTTEIDEYTKAVDGVLIPDIAIPYVAADYLSGKDAMLEKLLAQLR